MYVAFAAMLSTMLRQHQLSLPFLDGLSQSGGTALGIAKQDRAQALFKMIDSW